MPWYAAHAIFLVKFDDGVQDNFPIQECVYLVRGDSPEAANAQAIEIAELPGDGSEMTCNERAAHLTFVGIRKLIEVDIDGRGLQEGVEATYSFLEVDSEEDLQRLVNGDEVRVLYVE